MNKKAYKWLAVTLLLSVSVFCFLYLTKILKTDSGQAVAVPDVRAAEPETPDDSSEEIVETEPTIKPVYYNTLPRTAENVDGYLVQNIGGTADEVLKSVHTVGTNTVVFFETSSNGFDIKTERKCVAAALLNGDLTLTKITALCGDEEESFAAVKQIADGFILVTRAQSYCAIYKLDFNLVTVRVQKTVTALGFSLYLSGTNLLLISEYSDKLQISLLADNLFPLKTATVFIDGAIVTDIFPIGNALNIFAQTEEGYALLRYTEDGGFFSINEVAGYTLLSVLPYSDDGALKFAGLRKNGGGLSVFTANADFGITNEVKTQYQDFAELFTDSGNFTVYGLKNGGASISVYCKHLDLIMETDAPAFTSIPYRSYAPKGNIVGFADNTLSLCTFDGFSFTVAETYQGTDAYCYSIYDGTFVFSSTYKSDVFVNNFGSNDIFLIKKLG